MPDTRQLGEYSLTQLLQDTPSSLHWSAVQNSIARKVLLHELKPEAFDQREAFLADVRAKANCEHPLISSIYEAVSNETECYFAHEWLPGATFEDRRTANAPFQPLRMAHFLLAISEAYLYLESTNHATSPLNLSHIFVDEQGVLRLSNLTIHGQSSPNAASRDISYLGHALVPLTADSQAGSTRMATLLAWMRGEQIDTPFTWANVRDVANQIVQQLSEPTTPHITTQQGPPPTPKPFYQTPTALGIAAIAIGLIAVLFLTKPKSQSISKKLTETPTVSFQKNRYPTQDGGSINLPSFKIARNEVTIGQYAEFLDTLNTLVHTNQEKTYNHQDQPSTKTHHTPDDWDNLYATAKKGGLWKNHLVTVNHPVVGVDWWDAYAFAKWQHARLPTQEEWFAAVSQHKNPKSIPPSDWNDVTLPTSDSTPNSIINLAGSVAEWSLNQSSDPTNPLAGQLQSVIVGGSYSKPNSKATDRTWLDDRSTRKPDLGFRLAFDCQ